MVSLSSVFTEHLIDLAKKYVMKVVKMKQKHGHPMLEN